LQPIQYNIFEVLPGGKPVLHSSVLGLEAAWQKLYELAQQTANECFAQNPATREIVGQLNVPLAEERMRKRLFQIAYTESLGFSRADVLRHRGYSVTTVVGNQSAEVVLTSTKEHYDLFILGHAATEATRKEIVAWLKARFPDARILALNRPHQQLGDADFNVRLNGPETWMPAVAQALA